MATYAVQKPVSAGVALTYAAVAASDDWVNSGGEFLHVKNGGAGACTVTVTSVANCNQGVNHPLVVSVPAGSDRMIGPLPPAQYNDPITNKATVGYSPTTTVTAAVIGR